MKHKTITSIAILMFALNIGLANTNSQVFNKASKRPRKPGVADAMTVTNNFYDLIVENVVDNYGVGTYTVRTGTAHPATIAMGSKQNVLYGGTSGVPWSTYLTVKSYTSNTNYYTGNDYYIPDSGCTGMQLDYNLSSITQPTSTSILGIWNVIGENDFLKIKQNTFIEGTTLDDSKIGVTTTVKNTGYDTVKIGIRYEWDIMIDGNDAARYRTKNPEGAWLEYETQWASFNYTHYEITDYPFGTPTFYNLGSVIGPTYLTPPPSPPDLLQYAGWSASYSQAFNYTLQGYNLSYTDSAILYYWGNDLAHAIKIAPGDSVMVTQYLFASLLTINYQPDNHIKNSDETSYIGDNIYNQTGIGQTKEQTASPIDPAIYHIKIENDGTGQDGFIVNKYIVPSDDIAVDVLLEKQSWNIEYYDALIGGNNITSQMTSGGWSTGPLNPGQFREIRMEVTPDGTAPSGSVYMCGVLSTSVNDITKKDLVNGVTTATVYHDVGPLKILVPIDTILAGTVVTPRVVVKNFGNQPASPARVYISFGPYNSIWSGILEPGQIDTVEFLPPWTATVGFYNTVARTQLPGDNNPANDTTYGSFVVIGAVVHDVGATQILAPIGSIPSGTLVTPKVIIQNFGNEGAEGTVYFQFGSYNNNLGFYLASGQIDTIELDAWNAVVGSYLEKAFTVYSPDQNVHNDTAYNEFSVYSTTVHDVGVTQILAPTGNTPTGTVVIPTAVIHNFGTENETSIPVYFTIGGYNSTRTISLDVGVTDTVEFDNWTAVVGSWTGVSYTALATDDNLYNDTARYRFSVIDTAMIDISIVDILVPDEPIITCYDYEPAVLIHTQGASGNTPCSVLVRIVRYPSRMISFCNAGVDSLNGIVEYEEWINTSVNPGYDTVYLPTYHPYWWDIDWTTLPAYHEVYAEVTSPYDENPDNNNMSNQFTVDGRANDLQMNWTGLLDGYEVMHAETIDVMTYNVASVVSLSAGGPSARFRAWVNIIRESDEEVVYTRYKDVTMLPGTYYCVPFSTGWTATEQGSYLVRSWVEARPGVDVIAENNDWERRYYVIVPRANTNTTLNPPGNSGNMPTTFNLITNNPNPFSNKTKIQWQIPIQSKVIISVYDATGRNIRTIVNDNQTPGYYSTTWNRADDSNKKVSSGIYFYEMKTNHYTARRKMVITN